MITTDDDRTYLTESIAISTDRWLDVEASLDQFRSNDPTLPSLRPDSRTVRMLAVQNVTAFLSADRGSHEIWIDDLEIW